MLLIKNSALTHRHEIENALGKDATGEQVLDHIFGTYDTNYQGSTNFVIRTWDSDSRTFANRLNMFWAMPLTLLLAPFMYLKDGQVGWSSNSAAGRFVLKVTGHLKD